MRERQSKAECERPSTVETKCRNCGCETTFLNRHDDDRIVTCETCGAYQYIAPLNDVAALYTEDYYTGAGYIGYTSATAVNRLNFIRKIRDVKRLAPELEYQEMRVLEIGCATGGFLDVMREHGVENMLGVEVSEYCREESRRQGFEVLDPFAPDCAQRIRDFKPNMLCAWDVWEHLEYPGDVFTSIITENPSIKMVALSTVDSGALVARWRGVKWRQFHPPTHLNYPTRKSFELYFKAIGYKIVSHYPFGYSRPLAEYLSLVINARKLRAYPWLFRIPLYLNLYDAQMVVAKRA